MKSTFPYEMFFLWMIPMLALGRAVLLRGYCPIYANYYCSCSENDVAALKPIKLCPYLKEYFATCIPCPTFQQSQIQCSCPLDECLICSAQQFGSETYIKNKQAFGTNYTTPRMGFIRFIQDENRFHFSQNLRNKPKANLSYSQLKVLLEAFRSKQKSNDALKEMVSLPEDEHAEQNMTLRRQYIRPKTGDISYFGQDILPKIQGLRIRRQNQGSNNEELEVKTVKKSRSKQNIGKNESYMSKNNIQPEAERYFVLMSLLMVPQVYIPFEKFNKNASEIMNKKMKTSMLGRPVKLPIKTVNPLNFLVVEPRMSEYEKDITSFGRFMDAEKSANKKDNEKKCEFDTTEEREYQRQNFEILKNVNEIPVRSEFKEINRNKNDSISLPGEGAITNLQLLIGTLLGKNSQEARYESYSKMSAHEKEIIDEDCMDDDKNMIDGSPIGEKDINAEELMMSEEDMIDVIRKMVEEDQMFIFSEDSVVTKFGKTGNSEKTHSDSKKISKRFLGNENHPINYIFNQSETKIRDLPEVSNDYDDITLDGKFMGRRLLQSSEANVDDDDDDYKIKELFQNDTGYRDITEKFTTRYKTEDENMTEENSTANEKDLIDEELIIHENRTIEDESQKISRRFLGNETNAMNYNFNQSEDKIPVLLAVTNGNENDILNTTFIGRRLLQSSDTTDDDDLKKNGMLQKDTAYMDNVQEFPTRDYTFNKSEGEIQPLSKVTKEYEKIMRKNGTFIRRGFSQSNKTNEDNVVAYFSLNDTFLNTRRKRSTLPENKWCPVNLKRKNGYLDCTIWTYKKLCTLDCHEGYALNGQKKVTFKCQRKANKFAPEITACLPTEEPQGKPNRTEHGQDYDQNRFPDYAEQFDESEYAEKYDGPEYAEQYDGQPEMYEDQDYGEYENPQSYSRNQQGVQPDDEEYYGQGDAYDTGPQYHQGNPEYYENGEYGVDYPTK